MATVYRARDAALGRDVAIKVLHAELAGDDAFVRRFANEAATAARLVHTNVACVFDIGYDGERPFIVMEYVSGGSLRDILRARGVLGELEARRVGRALCEALAAAHAGGILHRDVKPANVLLAADGTPKLADFGIAAARDADAETLPTRSGTSGFWAPEQARGEPATVGSDLYGLGATLFVAVTERLPSPGDTDLRAYADVSAAFADVVERCLRHDERSRFASATDVAAALDARHPDDPSGTTSFDAILDAPTLVAPHPKPLRAKPKRTGRLVAVVFATLVVVAIGAGIVSLLRPRTHAVATFVARPRVDAMRAIRAAGFVPRVVGVASSRVPAGRIVAQRPVAGTALAAGATVTLDVSTGPPLARLPDVLGLAYADARAHLDLAQFRSTTYPRSAAAAIGTIVGETPAGGTMQRPGTRVTLEVSVGPAASDAAAGGVDGGN